MFADILCTKAPASPLPDCFRDLNLHGILSPVLKEEPELKNRFFTPLKTREAVRCRQEIFKDLLQDPELWDRFSLDICALSRYQNQAEADLHSGDPWRCHNLLFGHILNYGERYCNCIRKFEEQISFRTVKSQGLRQALDSLNLLCASPRFTAMENQQKHLRQQFQHLTYCIHIRYGTVRIKQYEGEENLSEKILSVFQKFRQEDSRDYRQEFRQEPHADHVEAEILRCLSKIYPEVFQELSDYVRDFSHFLDDNLLDFCRELRFYLDWILKTAPLRQAGLPFCFPEMMEGRLFCNDFYDMSLAEKIGNQIVKNDFYLDPGQRILVVTGPNQGGKTTFARALGQIHYLASLGLFIPGSSANLQLTDQVLTHFEREETGTTGRLQDDLYRLKEILCRSTGDSLLIFNEIFASTMAEDALSLGRRMLESLTLKGSLAVVVTFLSELSEFGPQTVSMMSTVDPEANRTFRVVRKPPDDRTYAMTLAEKHRLTYEEILRRIQS